MALEDRIDSLERLRVREKWADPRLMHQDIQDLKDFKSIFSTKDYR